MTDNEMKELYTIVIKNVASLVQDYDPLAVAGVMMAQSLSIYRSSLTEDDYNSLVESILARKDNVKTFNNRGMLH